MFFFVFCFATVQVKNFFIVFKGVRIEVNFCKDENVLGVGITSQKFGFLVYFISVAIQS